MDHPIQTDFIRWIVFLPLLGAIVNGVLGAKIQKSFGKGAIALLACAPVVIAFGLSLYAFFVLKALEPEKRFLIDNLYRWIDLGSLQVDMAFLIDPLSAVMILVVTGIGGLIHIYATGYMHDDNAFWRFFAYLNLFTAAMLTLVLGDSLLLLFVGWEGVGLCSYALIGFWYTDHNNARAGNKAFIVNRVGDFGFVLGMFLLFWSLDAQGHGTLTVREMVQWAPTIKDSLLWGWPVITLATLFLFVGATGKSAQIPLFVWLPDAMAGPTPVSALIHAATMVTAGVYMTARMNVFFSMAPTTLHVIAVIGVATALVAASIALTQYDIKKVLAYSTVSQLGYMFIGIGVGGYAAAVFHLMTHAFFKACLFLGAGSVIHAMHHEQDMRKMGGLKAWMPVTFITFFISVLAIAGFPPFAGFFSKDEILWLAASNDHWIIWFLAVCGAGLIGLLHVSPTLHDFLRHEPSRSSHPGAFARIAAGDDPPFGHFGHRRGVRRLRRPAGGIGRQPIRELVGAGHPRARRGACLRRARVGSDGGFCFGGVVGRFSRVSDVSPGITFAGDLRRSCRRIVLSFVRPQMVFR